MDHNYIQNNDLIDKYILLQLTEEEETGLEEHLLFCKACSDLLEKRKALIGIIRNDLPDEINMQKLNIPKKNKRPVYNFTFFLKIAATIIFLISLTWFGLLLFNIEEAGIRNISLHPLNIDSIKNINVDSTIEHKINEIDYTKNEIQLAEAFQTLPVLENYIKNPVRSEHVEILSPKLNQRFKGNESIVIKWESNVYDSLNFVIFDNKAKLIFEKRVSANYNFKQKINPGLYYWQLETTEESLYTGKFTIIRN